MSDALCIDDDVVLFTALAILDDAVDEGLLVAVVTLRQQNVLCAVCDAAPQCDVAGITSHYLNDTAALMGSRGIAHFIDCLHRGVDCGIETNGVVRAGNI